MTKNRTQVTKGRFTGKLTAVVKGSTTLQARKVILLPDCHKWRNTQGPEVLKMS
jgi:hypothetical protein